jgi:hypothetical protein
MLSPVALVPVLAATSTPEHKSRPCLQVASLSGSYCPLFLIASKCHHSLWLEAGQSGLACLQSICSSQSAREQVGGPEKGIGRRYEVDACNVQSGAWHAYRRVPAAFIYNPRARQGGGSDCAWRIKRPHMSASHLPAQALLQMLSGASRASQGWLRPAAKQALE